MTSQPALPPTWRWSLPTTLVLLNLTLPTLAASFIPVVERPIPQLGGGLNLYPADQGGFDDFSFREDEKHLDRGFHDPLPKHHLHRHQNSLMSKIRSGFFGEFQRGDYDDANYDKLNTRGDTFKYSTSRNADSWGKFRAGPAKRGLHAPRIARVTPEDVKRPLHTVCIVYIATCSLFLSPWLVDLDDRPICASGIRSRRSCSRRRCVVSCSSPRAARRS